MLSLDKLVEFDEKWNESKRQGKSVNTVMQLAAVLESDFRGAF